VSLKFTNYTSKNCIIYKLNKYHYLDSELYVIDMQAVKEMARVFKNDNNVELIHLGNRSTIKICAILATRKPWSSPRATGTMSGFSPSATTRSNAGESTHSSRDVLPS
jgi:hypothetical protein